MAELYIKMRGDTPVKYAYGEPWVAQALLMDDYGFDTEEEAMATWENRDVKIANVKTEVTKMHEKYYALTDLVKLTGHLVSAMPLSFYNGIMAVRGEIESLPEADVVAVVRYRDCKHYNDGWCYNPNTYDDDKTRGNTTPDWFCADGERRTDG